MQLNLGQNSEARFGQDFNLSRVPDVWLSFWSWCLIEILWYELNPRVRCAFGNVFPNIRHPSKQYSNENTWVCKSYFSWPHLELLHSALMLSLSLFLSLFLTENDFFVHLESHLKLLITQDNYKELMCKNLQKYACSRTVFICTHSHYYPQECQKIGSRRNEGKIALVATGMKRIVSGRHNSFHLKSKTKK